jgi:phosphoribosylformylglycinamidine cyclo-ligase
LKGGGRVGHAFARIAHLSNDSSFSNAWITRLQSVDIDAGNETVRRIRSLARSTFTAGVLSDIGSFAGCSVSSPYDIRSRVLVASADGVGTKLKVAFIGIGATNSVGVDLVNHCVKRPSSYRVPSPCSFSTNLATGRLAPMLPRFDCWRDGARVS